MSRILSSVVGLLAFCLFDGLVENHADAQSYPTPFNVWFEQLADAGGDMDYALTLPWIFDRPPSMVLWTGPAGSELVSDGSQRTFLEEDFASFSSKVFGTWQLDLLEIASMPAEHFEFTIASFSLDSVFHELSTIISPAPDSVVPDVFNLIWEYPDGAHTNGRSIRRRNTSSGINITGDFADGVAPMYEVTVTFEPGYSSGQATFQAGSYSANPTQITGDAAFQQRFTPQTSFMNLSPPVTFYFQIPEPASLILAGMAGWIGLGLLRHGSRKCGQ